MEYGIFSIIPIIVVLAFSFWKKNVFVALILGMLLSSVTVISATGDYLVGFRVVSEVFSLPSTSQVIFFLFLTGAIMHCANKSGGVEGLVTYCTEKRRIVKSKFGVELFTFILGLILFIDALSSIMITSSVGKPFFKKYNLPDEKLALISNSTGSAITWLVPFSGAGALMTSFLAPIVADMGLDVNPFELLMRSLCYQFYSMALFLVLITCILFRKDIGAMRHEMHKHNMVHTESAFVFGTDLPEGKKPSASSLVIPIVILVAAAFAIILLTGKGDITRGNVTEAMFSSGIITLFVTGLWYISRGLVTMDRFIGWCLEGMHGMFDVILIFVLAYAFGSMLQMLDTAGYVAHYAELFPGSLIMAVILAFTTCVAYATGSSSATVALLFPIFVPMAHEIGIPLPWAIGAIISGAVFGDQNSPISDSVILTSRISGVNIISHVRTQIPYTIIALAIAFTVYLLLSFTV